MYERYSGALTFCPHHLSILLTSSARNSKSSLRVGFSKGLVASSPPQPEEAGSHTDQCMVKCEDNWDGPGLPIFFACRGDLLHEAAEDSSCSNFFPSIYMRIQVHSLHPWALDIRWHSPAVSMDAAAIAGDTFPGSLSQIVEGEVGRWGSQGANSIFHGL